MLSHRIATNIGQDDRVVLYPTFGHLVRRGRFWRIPITGTVYACGDPCRRKRRWLRLLQRLNHFHPSGAQRELFEERVSAFLAPTQRGKCLALRVGGDVIPLAKKTKRNGLISSSLSVPASALWPSELADGWLRMDVVRPDGDDAGFFGMVRLLASHGVSVISDIDDTVKVTHVPCRESLLEYTFLREFETVDGIGDVYRRWASQGAEFHYVSSSPWQLYDPLAGLFQRARLPLGTFHLRAFRLHDPMLRRLWMLRKRAKASVLKSLLKTFPGRRFVLVGDSGERDPEIYGALARRQGSQIARVYIREVPQRSMSPARCLKAFRGLARCQWQVFQHPSELPGDVIPEGSPGR